jgi:hypothetical protein
MSYLLIVHTFHDFSWHLPVAISQNRFFSRLTSRLLLMLNQSEQMYHAFLQQLKVVGSSTVYQACSYTMQAPSPQMHLLYTTTNFTRYIAMLHASLCSMHSPTSLPHGVSCTLCHASCTQKYSTLVSGIYNTSMMQPSPLDTRH